eukprot:1138533-Pelagomonas_calceolata.AAC.2
MAGPTGFRTQPTPGLHRGNAFQGWDKNILGMRAMHFKGGTNAFQEWEPLITGMGIMQCSEHCTSGILQTLFEKDSQS